MHSYLLFTISLCFACTLVLATTGRWSLKDKNIVVTGGSKGIGLAIVKECSSLGANVLTCARSEKELDVVLETLKTQGFANIEGIVADVSTEEGRSVLINACAKRFSKLDCLINNVGSNLRKPMIAYERSDYDFVMKTNLESVFFVSQGMHSQLKASGNAAVINIGSVAGGCSTSMRSGAIYAMTKAAMCQLTANLACEWALDNIRGTCRHMPHYNYSTYNT